MVFYGDAKWAESNEAEEVARQRAAAEATAATTSDAAAAETAVAVDEEPSHFPEGFHPHESPWTMTVPLVVLAVLAAMAGLLNLPFPASWHFLENWLEPSFALSDQVPLGYSNATIVLLLAISTVVALTGIAIAWLVYERHALPVVEPEPLHDALYIDSSIAAFVGGPGTEFAQGAATVDSVGIDGAVNGVGRLTRWTASRVRVVQTGYVRVYALMVAAGSVLLIAFVLTRMVTWR